MIEIFILILFPLLLSPALYAIFVNLNGRASRIMAIFVLYTTLFIATAIYMNGAQPGDPFVIISGLLLLSFSIACPPVIAVFYFEDIFKKGYGMAGAFLFPLAAIPYLAFLIRPEMIDGQPLPPDYFQGIIPLFGWLIDPVFRDAVPTVNYETSIVTGLISYLGIFFEVLVTLFILCIVLRKIRKAVDNTGS